MGNFIVRKAAVLGSGVMGAQIAAHLANADVPVVLFGRPAASGDPNATVVKAIAALSKLEPSPLAAPGRAAFIDAANYGEHLEQLRDCNLIIEAVGEKMQWKDDLYRQIAPYISPTAIVASNTSGLSIDRLATALPEALRARFCGVHFFNPPRVMPLVELIATRQSAPELLDELESWLVTRLGKGVVRALDTPNFVANRVGIFSMLVVMHHAEVFGLGFDVADALTGPLIGRARSATFRTADIVGLDTMAHIIQTLHETLAGDPWHAFYQSPPWLAGLITKGALGQKTRAGIFRKNGQAIQVLDLASGAYRDALAEVAPAVREILKNPDAAARFAALRASDEPQAQFLWAIFRDLFHYVAVHLAAIADNARDVDFAMRWGFGWIQGPFETWQTAGWKMIADAVQDDIDGGRAMSREALPDWVFGRVDEGVHTVLGSYSASADRIVPRSRLPVYRRQIFPERILGEQPVAGQTIWENAGVRLWTLPELDSTIAIVSVTTKNHVLGREVTVGLQQAIARAETDYRGLVLWQEAPFAFGADLKEVSEAVAAGQYDRLTDVIEQFQNASMAIKYAQIPVVAAVSGMALGGGCELLMHAARRVLALESTIGLVEASVGLIPAGGGCKEFAVRAWQNAQMTASQDPFEFISPVFATIAKAIVAKSALHARELGFALACDIVAANTNEVLYIAVCQARAMAAAGYHPPLAPRAIKVAGHAGIAHCETMLINLRERGVISAYDYTVAQCAAMALCGGDVDAGSLVDEAWLLAVERRLFVHLLKNEKTQQRIAHTLATGKPLRN